MNKVKSTFLKEVCLVVNCLLDPMQLDHIEDRVLSGSDKMEISVLKGTKCCCFEYSTDF